MMFIFNLLSFWIQIVIIQACQHDISKPQTQAHASVDAEYAGSGKESKEIELKRPHTLLLMSTVAGGYATRGKFTGALSRQFAGADGVRPIEEMVTSSIRGMKQTGISQNPEQRNTLQKRLILPQATPQSGLDTSSLRSKEDLLNELGVLRRE